MNKRKFQGLLLAGISGILWGTYGTFVTGLNHVGFSQAAIAVFAPISLILFFGISALLRQPRTLLPNKKQFVIYLLCGIIGVLGTNLLYSMAMAAGLSVAIASVITFSNYFLVMFASRFIWKIKITAPKIGAGVLALFGIFLLLKAWTDLSATALGLLLIVGVTFTFAFGYVITKFAFDNADSQPDAFYFWINFIGFIATCFFSPPWEVFGEISSVYATHGFTAILLLLGFIIIPQIGSYFPLGRAFQRIEAPLVVIMYSLDPITSAILGFVILGQVLDLIQVAGMLVIIIGLIWLQYSELKESRKATGQVVEEKPETGI